MDKAKLFKNGRSQAVRLPKKYRFKGSDVFIHKIGNSVVLLPQDSQWQNLIDSLDKFSDDFIESRNQPRIPKRDNLS